MVSRRDEKPEKIILSRRERSVLQLFAQGMGRGQAAKTLGVSVATVRQTARNIKEKLGLPSTATSFEIVAIARQRHLL